MEQSLLAWISSHKVQFAAITGVIAAAAITISGALYWHLYISHFAQLALHQIHPAEASARNVNIQEISFESIAKDYPKLAALLGFTADKYNKAVAGDCLSEYGDPCNVLMYSISIAALDPDEYSSLVNSGSLSFHHYRWPAWGLFGEEPYMESQASVRVSCEYDSVDGGQVIKEKIGQGSQYCYYELRVKKWEGSFMERLLRPK